MLDITIKREVASTTGIFPYTIDNTLDDAFGQRIVSTMYTTLNQYQCRPGGRPQFLYSPEALNQHLCQNRRVGSMCRYRRWLTGGESRAARGQPSGPGFPSVTIFVQFSCRAPRSAGGKLHPAD